MHGLPAKRADKKESKKKAKEAARMRKKVIFWQKVRILQKKGWIWKILQPRRWKYPAQASNLDLRVRVGC